MTIKATDFSIQLPSAPKTTILHRRLSSFAPNTQRAITSDWKVWQQWCCSLSSSGAKGRKLAFPAKAKTLERFVYAMSPPLIKMKDGTSRVDGRVKGGSVKSAKTVARYLSSLKTVHRISRAGVSAFSHPDVQHALRTIQRGRMTSKPKKPFRLKELERFLAEPAGNLRDFRDRAIAAVGYFGLLRRSEIVALTVDDFVPDDDGSATIRIRNSKTDQEGQGFIRYLAPIGVTAVKAWIARSRIKDGPLFRRVLISGHVAAGSLRGQQIARIMKLVAVKLGLNPLGISGHSLRIGGAHDLVSSGFGLPAVMQAGGWSSPTMPAMYTRELAVKQSAMALMISQGSQVPGARAAG